MCALLGMACPQWKGQSSVLRSEPSLVHALRKIVELDFVGKHLHPPGWLLLGSRAESLRTGPGVVDRGACRASSVFGMHGNSSSNPTFIRVCVVMNLAAAVFTQALWLKRGVCAICARQASIFGCGALVACRRPTFIIRR